ncbi:MAG: class I SAM-dependent methyltransferase [Alphaproteobacteria bacterium]|nr:class I SAM-dependent methyltransferase [Alphaproteobacteria bacterium]
MPYNLDIPGQVSETQLKAIELVASLVPKDGTVIEVGSLFGRSSWAWAKSVDPFVSVNCIDPWVGNEGVRVIEQQLGIKYGLEQFQEFTKDCENLTAHKGFSPRDFQGWDKDIDLYYEDAVHDDPVFSQNLDFWTSKLKPEGIVCGDDYRPRFADVQNGARRVAERLGRELITVDFFWCVLPPEHLVPGTNAVAAQLKRLSAEFDAAKRSKGPMFSIGPLKFQNRITSGDAVTVEVRFTNEGIDPWPENPEDQGTPIVGVRVVREDDPSTTTAEHQVELTISRFEPDIPHHFMMDLPTKELPAGAYRVVFDLLGKSGEWRMHPTIRPGLGIRLAIHD